MLTDLEFLTLVKDLRTVAHARGMTAFVGQLDEVARQLEFNLAHSKVHYKPFGSQR